MSGKHKTWSKSEKLEIIHNSKHLGVVKASRQFGISATSIYKWQAQLDHAGLSTFDKTPSRDRQMGLLEREIHALKMIVAEKEMTIRIQDELLKKNR